MLRSAKNILALSLGAAVLGGCGASPSERANTLYVEASTAAGEYQALNAQGLRDYETMRDTLRIVEANRRTILARYPETAVAVQIASSGQIGALSVEDVAQTLFALERCALGGEQYTRYVCSLMEAQRGTTSELQAEATIALALANFRFARWDTVEEIISDLGEAELEPFWRLAPFYATSPDHAEALERWVEQDYRLMEPALMAAISAWTLQGRLREAARVAEKLPVDDHEEANTVPVGCRAEIAIQTMLVSTQQDVLFDERAAATFELCFHRLDFDGQVQLLYNTMIALGDARFDEHRSRILARYAPVAIASAGQGANFGGLITLVDIATSSSIATIQHQALDVLVTTVPTVTDFYSITGAVLPNCDRLSRIYNLLPEEHHGALLQRLEDLNELSRPTIAYLHYDHLVVAADCTLGHTEALSVASRLTRLLENEADYTQRFGMQYIAQGLADIGELDQALELSEQNSDARNNSSSRLRILVRASRNPDVDRNMLLREIDAVASRIRGRSDERQRDFDYVELAIAYSNIGELSQVFGTLDTIESLAERDESTDLSTDWYWQVERPLQDAINAYLQADGSLADFLELVGTVQSAEARSNILLSAFDDLFASDRFARRSWPQG